VSGTLLYIPVSLCFEYGNWAIVGVVPLNVLTKMLVLISATLADMSHSPSKHNTDNLAFGDGAVASDERSNFSLFIIFITGISLILLFLFTSFEGEILLKCQLYYNIHCQGYRN
jgi:hypothetical protein